MGLIELLVLAVGLSMDAFAVSVCKGLSLGKISFRHMALAGVWFGGFQALMPLVGYLLASTLASYVTAVAHWIAFGLLLLIGGNMIRESFSKDEEEVDASMGVKSMLLLAIATSIDALAVGVTFACVPVHVIDADAIINTLIGVILIGITTFVLSCAGIKAGSIFGEKYKSKAEFAGGVVLVLLGIKILVEGLIG